MTPLTELICRFCGACNRPGIVYVERLSDGTLLCSVCSKAEKEAQP